MKTEITWFFKVLSAVAYCSIDKYVCTDYLCLQKVELSFENKLSLKIFNDISGIIIPELLMKIISVMNLWTIRSQLLYFHVLANLLIITYQKVLLFLKTIQVPLCVKQIINADNLHKS